MDIKKQLEDFKQIVKAPPIRNPREEEFADRSNDDLDMAGFERLFEKVVDPIIRESGEKKQKYAVVPFKDLKMSRGKAGRVAQELYGDKGYADIVAGDTNLLFQLEGQLISFD